MTKYLLTFVALLGLTAANVALTRLAPGRVVTVVAAFGIAGVEALLAAMVFMHLGRERRWVHGVLILTLIVLAGLLLWPAWDVYDRPRL